MPYLLFLFALLLPGGLVAQPTQHFRGRVDGYGEVLLSIACRTGTCTGTVTHLSSETTLPLDGTRTDDGAYRLRELTGDGRPSGYLSGTQRGSTLRLTWTDPAGERAADYHLTRVTKPDRAPGDCSRDTAWWSYRDATQYLLLHRQPDRRWSGHFYRPEASYTVRGTTADTSSTPLSLVLVDAQGTRAGLLRLPQAPGEGALRGECLLANGTRTPLVLEPMGTLGAHCEAFADFYTRYELFYPVSPTGGFTAHLARLTDSWLRECRRRATVVAARQSPSADQRATERAYAQTDLVYADEKLFSGLLTFASSQRAGSHTVAFNYDVQRDRPLDLYDLIRADHGFEDYLANRVRRYFRDHELARTDPGFRDWIESNSFAHWTVRPDGLAFHTDFSTLYGRHHLLLSYKKLKPYLRKDAAVRRLAR